MVLAAACLPTFACAQSQLHSFAIQPDLDVSGIVVLDHSPTASTFLVVHDSKRPGQPRVGVVSLAGDALSYRALPWPKGYEEPIDAESLNRYLDGGGFVLMTSRGLGVHFTLSDSMKSLNILDEFTLPLGFNLNPEIEGLSLNTFGRVTYAFWADRGADERPGTLSWGRFDGESLKITPESKVEIKVPWPTASEVRHISELRINAEGEVYITSASDSGDKGPFVSAFYHAGQFHLDEAGNLQFDAIHPLEPGEKFESNKVEAFDLTGDGSGAAFATDDEKLGSTLFLTW